MKNPIRENRDPIHTVEASPLRNVSKSNATVHVLERNLMHCRKRQAKRGNDDPKSFHSADIA